MTKYKVAAIEHVYDEFDDYEHANPLTFVEVEAISIEEAAILGRELLQKKIDERRREGGFLSTGTFIVEVRDIYAIDEYPGREEQEVLNRHKAPDIAKLRVFICHASENKENAIQIYQMLLKQGNIDPWLDKEKILPGQDWDAEIKKAVKGSHAVIVLLSNKSTTKEGYVQKEIRQILDVADEKPDDTIFIIPIKLGECNVPQRLQKWQWLESLDGAGFGKLLHALEARAKQLGIDA